MFPTFIEMSAISLQSKCTILHFFVVEIFACDTLFIYCLRHSHLRKKMKENRYIWECCCLMRIAVYLSGTRNYLAAVFSVQPMESMMQWTRWTLLSGHKVRDEIWNVRFLVMANDIGNLIEWSLKSLLRVNHDERDRLSVKLKSVRLLDTPRGPSDRHGLCC